MQKNICLIIDTLSGRGGTERVVLSLAQALSKLECRVDIIVLDGKEGCYAVDNPKFNTHLIEKNKNPKEQAKNLKLKIAEIGINFNLFVANLGHSIKVCRNAQLPNTYYCIHGMADTKKIDKFIRKIKFFVRGLSDKNQKFITVSKGDAQYLLTLGVNQKNVQTIYNPFDFNDIREQAEAYSVEEQDYIVHAGRFDSIKRHDVLINAYKQSNISQKLMLLGDDNNEIGKEIRQLVSDLDIEDKVIFKGFVSNPFPYVKNAKTLILNSDSEAFGMVLVEALILGTPIVSTNCESGPSEILIDKLQPFLSPIGDANVLAKNIKKMVGNPVKITDKYIDKFSAEKSAKQYLALCN